MGGDPSHWSIASFLSQDLGPSAVRPGPQQFPEPRMDLRECPVTPKPYGLRSPGWE